MTMLEVLRRAAPRTSGPDAATVAAERERFVAFMREDDGRARREGLRVRWLAVAAVVAVIGAAVVLRVAENDAQTVDSSGATASEGSALTRGIERKTTASLPDGGRLELWATPTPRLGCVELRRVPAPAEKRAPTCFASFGARRTGLTYAVELVDGDTFAFYGRVPTRTTSLAVDFESGDGTAVRPRNGWYLFVGPSPLVAPPARLRAWRSGEQLDDLEPRPLRPIAADQAAACPTPTDGTDSRTGLPLTLAEQSYAARNPDRRLILQGRPRPSATWSVFLQLRRGEPYLSFNHAAAEQRESGGSTSSPRNMPLDSSQSSMDAVSNAVLGQVSADATCVVVTDVLGRRLGTDRLVADDRFPGREFWAILVPSDTAIRSVDAFNGTTRVASEPLSAMFLDRRL